MQLRRGAAVVMLPGSCELEFPVTRKDAAFPQFWFEKIIDGSIEYVLLKTIFQDAKEGL